MQMNQLIEMHGEMTMSSFDFLNNIINPARGEAGESKVRNNDFVARIEDEIDDLGAYEIFVSYGKESKLYFLNLEQMTLVGMRESKAVRRSVLAKLKEIGGATKPALPDFTNPVEAARAWADEVEKKQIAQQHLAIAAPKAEVYDKVMERETLLNATQVAQQVGMSAIKMNRKLDEIGGVYNRCVKRGRAFRHDWVLAGNGEMNITETGHAQPLFTAKGSLRVVEILTGDGVV